MALGSSPRCPTQPLLPSAAACGWPPHPRSGPPLACMPCSTLQARASLPLCMTCSRVLITHPGQPLISFAHEQLFCLACQCSAVTTAHSPKVRGQFLSCSRNCLANSEAGLSCPLIFRSGPCIIHLCTSSLRTTASCHARSRAGTATVTNLSHEWGI